jgi:hypothetical protein
MYLTIVAPGCLASTVGSAQTLNASSILSLLNHIRPHWRHEAEVICPKSQIHPNFV